MIHSFLLAVLLTNSVPVSKAQTLRPWWWRKKRIPSRGYQELFQLHICRTMFVDIADTTVPNLIYVLNNDMFTT